MRYVETENLIEESFTSKELAYSTLDSIAKTVLEEDTYMRRTGQFMDAEQRVEFVDNLLERYGELVEWEDRFSPSNYTLTMLSNFIMADDFKNRDRMKSRNVEYSFLTTRQQKRRRRDETTLGDLSEQLYDVVEDANRLFGSSGGSFDWDKRVASEDAMTVEQAVKMTDFTRRQQEVFDNLYVHGYNMVETADKIGISVQSVSKTHQRILERVAKSLRRLEFLERR